VRSSRIADAGWRRPIGCLKLQVFFRKRATNHRSLFREITCKDRASYGSWWDLVELRIHTFEVWCFLEIPNVHVYIYTYMHTYTYVYMCVYVCLCVFVWPYFSSSRSLILLSPTLVGSIKLYVSFAKEPYKRNDNLQKRPVMSHSLILLFPTGWQRPIGCLKLQVIFRKRATNLRALLRKTTYKDKASYEDKASYNSTPPPTPKPQNLNSEPHTPIPN